MRLKALAEIYTMHSFALDLLRSRRELSNAYLLSKLGFDTAENEPSKVCSIERRVVEVAEVADGYVGGRLRERLRLRHLQQPNPALDARYGNRLDGRRRRDSPGQPVQHLVQRFDIEPYSDFSAK